MKKTHAYLPDYIFNNIMEVTPEFLKSIGVKGILVDCDNTIAYDNRKELLPDSKKWVKLMQDNGIKVCLMSNAFLVRVRPVARQIKFDAWTTRSHKPRPIGFKRCIKMLGLEKDQVAILGDQMKTDIVGGNNYDIPTLYLMPYAFETNPFYKNIFKKRRGIERKYFKMYNEQHGTQFDFPDVIKAEMHEEDLKECVY